MANTLVLLEKVTVGAAGASSITFSNIPQTGYNDLKVVMSVRDTYSGAAVTPQVSFNGLTTNRSIKNVYGSGSAASSFSDTQVYFYTPAGTATATTFGNAEMYVPNYTSSNYKSISIDAVGENNATGSSAQLGAALWSSTAAITSIGIAAQTAFAQYSTFSLYGVSNVNTTPTKAPKATGGDIIQTDGTYWYHAFINSGSFTPATSLSADVLVVAGGGGGGGRRCGGGGAGGLLAFTSQSLSAINYTCTVGAGGAGGSGGTGNTPATFGAIGSNSQFGSLTASVGGGYASGDGSATAAGTGGSGGGSGGSGSAGSATSGQGYNGGTSSNAAPNYGAGGGGGAGAVGTNGTTTVGGAGGIGSSAYSSWLSTTNTGVSGYIAGGGGGGTFQGGTSGAGGAGGGGAAGTGGTDNNGTAGTANTGGGGGGGSIQADSSNRGGGAGGSGIVIVRYTV